MFAAREKRRTESFARWAFEHHVARLAVLGFRPSDGVVASVVRHEVERMSPRAASHVDRLWESMIADLSWEVEVAEWLESVVGVPAVDR